MNPLNKSILPELLAPAKTKDIAISAINSGADAVYIGAPKFSARENASISLIDIEKTVKYAHLYNAKVYVALNTLFKDDELVEVKNLIKELYETGCDALIIQDFACLEMDLPPIPLHASTQMHNYSIERVIFLKEAGFKRVVLPREFSTEEIKPFIKLGIDIEVFIHGALCVCYSGQCYLSYAIGKRSANRGECAQPCRLNWKLSSGNFKRFIKDGHFLSLKDLNRFNHIKSFVEMGITSLKIEGRLKDEAYVKNVVSAYRKELDKIGETLSLFKPSNGYIESSFKPDLLKTFHRGYTDYIINNRQIKEANFLTPKNIGEYICKIKEIKGEWITLALKNNPLNCGDGIIFLSENKLEDGSYVNKIDGLKVKLSKKINIPKNSSVFRNYDKKFYDDLKTVKIKRYINAEFSIEGNTSSIIITLTDETGLTFKRELNDCFESANEPNKMRDSIIESFKKSGDSIFKITSVVSDFKVVPFLKKSFINNIRNEIFEELTKIKINSYKKEYFKHHVTNHPYPENEIFFEGNILNSFSKMFYERHNATVKEESFENGRKMNEKRVMTSRYCLRRELNACLKESINEIPEPITLENGDIKLKLKFDCKNCRMEIFMS